MEVNPSNVMWFKLLPQSVAQGKTFWCCFSLLIQHRGVYRSKYFSFTAKTKYTPTFKLHKPSALQQLRSWNIDPILRHQSFDFHTKFTSNQPLISSSILTLFYFPLHAEAKSSLVILLSSILSPAASPHPPSLSRWKKSWEKEIDEGVEERGRLKWGPRGKNWRRWGGTQVQL